MLLSTESVKAEESRIQKAYARRRSGNLYSRFNPAYLFMVQERERRFLRLLSQYQCVPLSAKRILEIGCGSGDLLRDLIKWGARPENVVGIDLLSDRVSEAIQLCPRNMNIQQGNTANLTFLDESFDVVLQSTVFTSVLDQGMKEKMAAEMCRVLKPRGLILWYDYHMDNPNNSDVKGVKSQEIRSLFPGCTVQLQRITLAPPLARVLAPYSWLLCHLLERIPWLCTHYVGVIRKNKTQ